MTPVDPSTRCRLTRLGRARAATAKGSVEAARATAAVGSATEGWVDRAEASIGLCRLECIGSPRTTAVPVDRRSDK